MKRNKWGAANCGDNPLDKLNIGGFRGNFRKIIDKHQGSCAQAEWNFFFGKEKQPYDSDGPFYGPQQEEETDEEESDKEGEEEPQEEQAPQEKEEEEKEEGSLDDADGGGNDGRKRKAASP